MIWWIVTPLLILGAPDTKVGERIFLSSLVLYLVVIGICLIIGFIQQPELFK